MSDENARQRERAKLGPQMNANGTVGGATALTVDATVRQVGPLPDGAYTLEPTVDLWALQGNADGLTGFAAGHGTFCPKNRETYFNVDQGDGLISYVRASADGTMRVNDRTNGKTS